MAISARIIFVLASQLLFIGFLIYNYIVFFQTDKIVAGLIGIASAILAIVVALGKLLPSNSQLLLQNYVYFIYKHIKAWTLCAAALWLFSIVWTYRMSNDVIGRLIYVKDLQESLARGALDRVSLPDPAVLASAFSRFPNRREVPLLLVRSSRLLYLTGRFDLFRQYQKAFFDRLDISAVVQKICADKKDRSRHDSIAFLLTIIGEAYAPNDDLKDDAYRRDVQSVLDKFNIFHGMLSSCGAASLESQFQLIKFEDAINDKASLIAVAQPYDIEARVGTFEQKLAAADQREVLEFWQSHGAQEFLDFQSYRLISKFNKDTAGETPADVINKVLSGYETLLLLRQSSLKSGDVEWSSPPHKLTLFYAFMLDGNVRSLLWKDTEELFTKSPQVNSAVGEFTKRKMFEEFRSPRGWYAGTPLDFGLNGIAVADKVNAWLKMDW